MYKGYLIAHGPSDNWAIPIGEAADSVRFCVEFGGVFERGRVADQDDVVVLEVEGGEFVFPEQLVGQFKSISEGVPGWEKPATIEDSERQIEQSLELLSDAVARYVVGTNDFRGTGPTGYNHELRLLERDIIACGQLYGLDLTELGFSPVETILSELCIDEEALG